MIINLSLEIKNNI